MGQDPRWSFDDVVGITALSLLLFAILMFLFFSGSRNTGPTYSTPNGEFPREATYLEENGR